MDTKLKTGICTLYQKEYNYGVAALLNSLFKSGYAGEFYIGFNESLPSWTLQLEKVSPYVYSINNQIIVHFLVVEQNMHYGYYKPFFINHLQTTYNLDKIYYFDPDICTIAKWDFFDNWVNSGISLCADNCYPYLASHHPWRDKWRLRFGFNKQVLINESLTFYVNSGFVGLSKADDAIIETWMSVTKAYSDAGGNVKEFEKAPFRDIKGDQDLLNAAITISPSLRYSVIGREAMGFEDPAYIMAHAINGIKPWKRKFTQELIFKNMKPTTAEKLYIENCNSPIKVFSNVKKAIKRIDIKLASALNRFL